jgi:hypothetical protein
MAIIKVVRDSDIGAGLEIAASKLRAKVDGTSIQLDGTGTLKTVLSPQVINDLVALSGLPANSTTLGTFTGSIVPDSQTVKQAIQALETAIESQNISGQFSGSAATVATLPTTTADGKPVNNGDWAILNTDDGANQAGIYMFNGTAYVIAKEIPEVFTLSVSSTDSATIDFSGVGTPVSPITANLKLETDVWTTTGLYINNGLALNWVDLVSTLVLPQELQDLSGNTIGNMTNGSGFTV